MSITASNLRGWVDIQEGWGEEIRPFSYRAVFHVYDWSEHRDSGGIVGTFRTRREAVEFAHEWADRWGRQLVSAEVIPLRREAAHG